MDETFTSATNGADAAEAPARSRLSFDLDVDICVVGAGLAGLTVALEAARLGASVAVLEGRHVGWNASGNQLGTVMPGYGLALGELIARIGLEDARELWSLSKEGAEFVRANATEAQMPGIALSEGALEVSNVEAGDALISRLQMLGEDFDTEVEGWQVDRVRAELKTNHYFHGVYYPKAFQVDGRKYLHGLAALARRAGARIFEDTPVVSIDPSGIRKRIVTPSARLRASHIVLAGNVHLGAPLRRLSETLLPVWRYAAVTEPLGERLAEAMTLQGIGERQRWRRPFPDRRGRSIDVGQSGNHLVGAARAFCAPPLPAGSTPSFRNSARSGYQRHGAAWSARPCTACRRSASCAGACGSPAVLAVTA